jgi:hypothetical protein
MGLALGLKDIFSPYLVPLVVEWFTREMDGEVRSQILDHLVRQSESSEAYRLHALDAFERASADARDRMLAAAAGTPLYSSLSQIKYNGAGGDLFGGVTVVQKNTTFNIGNIQAGAVAMEGDATQSGTTYNAYNEQTLEIIRARLTHAEREIKVAAADTEAKKEALLLIEAAKKEPTKDNLTKVVASMGKVESLATKALGTVTALADIARLIAQAAGIS